MNSRIIAVTGATGQQGGKVAKRLLEMGWQIRALTRNASKPAAQDLAAAGADVVPGDLDNPAELEAAFTGAYGVFSVQNFWLPNVGYEGEIRQGKAVADAAKAAGVRHLVYSSVGAAHRGLGQKHFESKWIIEQYVQSLDLPYTILRPAFFMENYNWTRAHILSGTFQSLGLSPDKTMQLVATDDIGVFAELAFSNPDQFLNKTVELAGDELTETQIAEIFEKVIGRPVAVVGGQNQPGEAPSDEQIVSYNFFNRIGYDADIASLRGLYPGLQNLEQYLRQNGWENAEPIPIPDNSDNWG